VANEKDKIELLIKVFDNQQTLISNADTKANIALSIQTFIITTILGASIIVGTFSNIATINSYLKFLYYVLFALFLISSIIGILISINVFKPRPPQEEKEIRRMGISYFGHIKTFNNSNEYFEEINKTELKDVIKEFAFQNFNLAHILHKKMTLVRHATTFLFVNIILGITLLIFSIMTK